MESESYTGHMSDTPTAFCPLSLCYQVGVEGSTGSRSENNLGNLFAWGERLLAICGRDVVSNQSTSEIYTTVKLQVNTLHACELN